MAHSTMPKPATNKALAYQYGGNYSKGWVGCLPRSWLPYVQLARLSPPVGLFLIFFPHAFGLLYTAARHGSSPIDVIYAAAVLFGYSFFVSSSNHIYNDLVDAPLDAKVERTRNRPIPRGAISPTAAVIFAASQVLGGVFFLSLFPGSTLHNATFVLPVLAAWIFYPYAKRNTYYTQAVLGVSLSWGVIMGAVALGVHPYSIQTGYIDTSLFLLFGATTFWTIIYDCIYGFQDLKDDLREGILSMPVLFQYNIKPVFWALVLSITASLTAAGYQNGMSLLYYLITPGGTTLCLGLMVANVDLSSSASCWWWFAKGFWYVAGSIITGLLSEYVRGLFEFGSIRV